MLEIPIYLLLVGAMGLVAIYSYVYAQRHLDVMEALSVMAGPRVTMMEFRAVTGAWPSSNTQAGFSDASFSGRDRDLYRLNSVQIREGGAIDFAFGRGALKPKVLSIKAWEGLSPGLPIEWTCGHALSLVRFRPADSAHRTACPSNPYPFHRRRHRWNWRQRSIRWAEIPISVAT